MSLSRSSLFFAAGTMFSRFLGLVRESVVAGIFGASYLLDIFLVANRIPNMLREIAAEGALGSSFTKVFSTLWEKDKERAQLLFLSTILFVLSTLMLICFICILGAPYLVKALMLFESADRQEGFFLSTIGLTRLLFPFIIFMSLASIFSGVLHQKGRFFTSAVSSVALNLGYIFGALVLASYFERFAPDWIEYYIAEKSICGLACGVLLGGFFQAFWLFWSSKDLFFKSPRLFQRFKIWTPDLKKVLLLMGPMVIAASAGQINVLVNTNFATSLEIGAVSYLNFAFRLLQLPVGVFAVAIGTASLPSFSKSLATQTEKTRKIFTSQIEKSIELTLWLLCPSLIFILNNNLEIIQLLFFHGNFGAGDTSATASCLFYYSFGVLGYGFIKVLSSVYYAIEKTNYAMKMSLIGIFSNLILNFLLVKPYGYNGLALATSLTLSINALLLFFGLKKYNIFNITKNIYKSIFFILIASLLCYFLQNYMSEIFINSSFFISSNIKVQSFLVLLRNAFSLFCIFLFFYLIYSKTKKPFRR